MSATYPSPVAILSVAAASALVHSALDSVPPAVVLRVARACGARSADGFDLRMWLHSLVMGVSAVASTTLEAMFADVYEPQRSF